MPVYVYVVGMVIYVWVGVMALAPCLVLALLPPMRRFALQAAGGIIGSYAGVLMLQLLTFPLLLGLFALFWAASLFPMNQTMDNVWNGLLVLVMMGWMGLSSLAGFLIGWRAGWHRAAGVPVRSTLKSTWMRLRLLKIW